MHVQDANNKADTVRRDQSYSYRLKIPLLNKRFYYRQIRKKYRIIHPQSTASRFLDQHLYILQGNKPLSLSYIFTKVLGLIGYITFYLFFFLLDRDGKYSLRT